MRENNFIIADDIGLNRGGGVGRSLEFFRLLCKLRKEDFDLSFVLQRAWPFRLLSCLAGVPVRVGFGCGRKDFFLTHSVFTHQIQNESESYLDLLRRMDISAVFKKTFYYLQVKTASVVTAVVTEILSDMGFRSTQISIYSLGNVSN